MWAFSGARERLTAATTGVSARSGTPEGPQPDSLANAYKPPPLAIKANGLQGNISASAASAASGTNEDDGGKPASYPIA